MSAVSSLQQSGESTQRGRLTVDDICGELKHRAEGETRPNPVQPELVTMLRNHFKEYGTGPGGAYSACRAAEL